MHEIDVESTDLIEYLSSKGYNAVTVDGYKVIEKYSTTEQEIDSLYSGVGLRNISHLGIVELKGNDVLDYLHRVSTNSTLNLPKAHTKVTLFTSDKGRIIGVTRLINFEDYQLLICDRESKSKVMRWVKKYVISDDVQVNDANAKYNLLELIGPQADSFIRLLCGEVVNEIETDTFKIIHTENLLFFLIKMKDERGYNKFWILSDLENSKGIINNLTGYEGPFNFSLIGEEAYNLYRIEQGIPITPNELNDNYNPHEARLMQYIDTTKGCYIGQEVIERLDTYQKVQKHLIGVKFNEQVFPDDQFTLLNENGDEIGNVTSIANSIKLDTPIGLAYVRKSFSTDGTKLIAKSTNGRPVNITVRELPFIK